MSGKILKALLILIIFTFTTGCWDQNEIENLGIVQAIGIDTGEKGVRLLVQVVNPKATGGGGGVGAGGMRAGGEPFRNFSAEGETIFTAFRELSHISPRKLFYAHTQVIVLSEKLARERNVMEVLDYFDRNPQVRRQVWVVVARSGINEIFNLSAPQSTTTATRIVGIIEQERLLTSDHGVNRLGDFLKLIQAEGTEAYTASIDLIPSKSLPQDMASHGEPGKEEIEITDTAVFKRGRLAGWLNKTEGRGLLWVKGKVEGGAIVIPCPGVQDKNISLDTLRSKTRITPEISDGVVRFRVEVTEESNIDESSCPLQLNKPEVIRQIEERQNEAIAGEITAALEKTQRELDADVFGFGNALFHNDPAFWKEIKDQWDDLFPNLEVEVEVDSRVRRTGLVANPARPSE